MWVCEIVPSRNEIVLGRPSYVYRHLSEACGPSTQSFAQVIRWFMGLFVDGSITVNVPDLDRCTRAVTARSPYEHQVTRVKSYDILRSNIEKFWRIRKW
jgi:hypothetical protein